MPSGIYGNRSIIPNNYYFTFDYIYADEDTVTSNNNDNVLIGRCVLAKAQKTVWLKTTNGYIKVAQLDNTARFQYSEGILMTNNNDNIDNILSYGDTPHGNGVYVVNYNTLQKENETWAGTWPAIRGMEDSNYLSGSTFILQQYTEPYEVTANDYKKIEKNNDGKVDFEKAWKYKNYLYYKEDNEYKKLPADYNIILTKVQDKIDLYILRAVKFKVYQILNDVSENQKPDKNVTGLYHNNKIFKRTGTFKYVSIYDNISLQEGETYSIEKYSFDSLIPAEMTQSNDGAYYKIYSWEEWKDLTEQYTGYLGDLDPLNANRDPDSNRENLKNTATLVQGLNKLDEIIGSKTRISNTYENNSSTLVKSITKGVLSNNLIEDNRPYVIKEKDLMDTVVRLAADIGDITEFNNLNNLNLVKTANGEINLDNVAKANIYSLTSAIKKLDNAIGSQNRLNKTTNIANSSRQYTVPENNLADALVRLAADIGDITGLDINNMQFSNNDNETNLSNNDVDKATIHSLISAIKKLDNAIGSQNKLGTGVNSRVDENYVNKRLYTIQEKNLVDAIVKIAADIGVLNYINNLNNLNYTPNDDKDIISSQAQIHSLVDIIIVLDKIIGSQSKLKENRTVDNRSYSISETNIIDTLVRFAADIGLRNQLVGQENDLSNDESLFTNLNTLNRNIGNISDLTGNYSDDKTTLISKLQAINDKIGSIDNLTGNDSDNKITLINKLQAINAKIGDISQILGDNNINDIPQLNDETSSDSFVNTLKTINTKIGRIDDFYGNNVDTEATDLINKLKSVNEKIGNIDKLQYLVSGTSNDTTVVEGKSLIDKLNNIFNEKIGISEGKRTFQEQLNENVRLINNLADNMDYLEILVSQGNFGGSNSGISAEWKTL